ncbi:MAG TPA: chaperone modulator CbpM [Stellaceae bacterium]|nr:chaperone modulator CbpM [Stellaceae bacterium]
MIRRTALLEMVPVESAELESWIGSGWIRPQRSDGDWLFDEIDVARVQLICEIRRDLAIDESALPLVLSLIDQVYGLRRDLAALCRAVAAQPEATRTAIAAMMAQAESERS